MNKIKISIKKGFVIINLDEILYCISDRNYTFINLVNQKVIKVLCPISKIESCLNNEHFIRVHKKYLVNNKHVIGYNKEACCITLFDNSELPVSKRKKSSINRLIAVNDMHTYFSSKTNVPRNVAVVL